MTDLLNEVQQVKIMGGEQSNSELKIYLGHCRTYYKNPDYIFLDEATNSLDANNERSIVENLDKFYKGKTVMIVAHRLSTVKNADQIVVIDHVMGYLEKYRIFVPELRRSLVIEKYRNGQNSARFHIVTYIIKANAQVLDIQSKSNLERVRFVNFLAHFLSFLRLNSSKQRLLNLLLIAAMTAMLFALQILPLALNTGIGLHLRHCLSPFKAITAILLYQIGKNKRIGSLLAIFRKNTNQEQIYRIRLVPLQNLQHL